MLLSRIKQAVDVFILCCIAFGFYVENRSSRLKAFFLESWHDQTPNTSMATKHFRPVLLITLALPLVSLLYRTLPADPDYCFKKSISSVDLEDTRELSKKSFFGWSKGTVYSKSTL